MAIELKTPELSRNAAAAQEILEVRKSFPKSSLADLYDSSSMPSALAVAHGNLNSLVLTAYELPKNANQSQILERLFNLYSKAQSEISLL